ncbi:hypothetical protein T440DRAFT_471187 [Plenodomus tracheiphilus IPT5]|uniref:Zn(2)-C6 fungal-type domain-containing protein n=1 Tax=Plenodomus tracheiphilus IPT5 TaxID=1408161 RepID=A0A6A7AYQ7_9PLEO|nr:hypothetical protein T440DRAFT_471187 [Plenodomus tracheiphilus IPT5]
MSHGSKSPSPSPSGSVKTLPKERGCFQCSRRRIICDRSEPTCKKCTKKGIECSGLGRIRFAEGVARRGQLKDLKVPVRHSDDGGNEALPVKVGYGQVRWKSEQKKPVKRRRKSEVFEVASPAEFQSIQTRQDREVFASATRFGHFSEDDDDDDVTEIIRDEDQILSPRSESSSIQSWIAPLSSEARMLFSYFSDAVAPVMVVLDTVPNGYREYILPMATEDDVLRRAVGVVAAQHLSRDKPELTDAAEAGRSAIISRLRKESLYNPADQVFNIYTWATLIVLLVGETVTGSADYSFLVHMLLCLSMNIRANHEKTNVTEFLQAQTNMFRFLGVPQLGEDNGVLAIMESYQSMIGWLSPACEEFPVDSDDGRTMQTIKQCFASASAIYIHRATTDLHTSTTNNDDTSQQPIIQSLIARLSLISPTSPGAHALVWVCFVAGAETSDPSQRQFFVDYMLAIYERTKFRNIPLGVAGLERIWARRGGKRWTQCLAELSNVLVM